MTVEGGGTIAPADAPTRERIAEAVAGLRGWAVDALCRLVREASVLGAERPAQEVTAALYEETGLAVRFEPVEEARIRHLPGFSPVNWSYEGRPNVVGVHEPPRTAGRSLILNGHVDVVSPEPVSLWTAPPFEPRLGRSDEDGEEWVHGRGAGDMKGGTVAALWGLAALRELGLSPAAPVIFESPIEEECTGNGTLALCAAGYRADACLVPEPFDETMLVRQLGVMWFSVRVLGSTTHVLGAGEGVNAIEKSLVPLRALRALEAEMNEPSRIPPEYRDVPHPINLNPGVIRGGDWPSTVAGECVIRYRLALFPGERLSDVRARVEARVAEAAAADPWLRHNPPTVEYIGFQAEGCAFPPDSAFGRSLARAHEQHRGSHPRKLTATCTTDIRHFNLYERIPATCYGPKARAIHGADERVSVDSMQRVAEVVASLVIDWCGVARRARARTRRTPRRDHEGSAR